jgi:hypothetical protein
LRRTISRCLNHHHLRTCCSRKIPSGEDGKMSYAYEQLYFPLFGPSTRAQTGWGEVRTIPAALLCDSCVFAPRLTGQEGPHGAVHDREGVQPSHCVRIHQSATTRRRQRAPTAQEIAGNSERTALQCFSALWASSRRKRTNSNHLSVVEQPELYGCEGLFEQQSGAAALASFPFSC